MNKRQHDENEVDLIDYMKVIYKHLKLIIILVFVSGLMAGILSLSSPTVYEATATFFPMNVRSYSSMIDSTGSPGGGLQVYGMKRQLDIEDLIISILESRRMADRVVGQIKLKDTWKIGLKTNARKELNGATNVTLTKKGLIKLSVKTISPELSAEIANLFVDNLDYFNKDMNLGADRQIVQVIDRAVVPKERMARGTVRKSFVAGFVALIFGIFLSFFIEFEKNNHIMKRLREA